MSAKVARRKADKIIYVGGYTAEPRRPSVRRFHLVHTLIEAFVGANSTTGIYQLGYWHHDKQQRNHQALREVAVRCTH